jgi:hypothetical protein
MTKPQGAGNQNQPKKNEDKKNQKTTNLQEKDIPKERSVAEIMALMNTRSQEFQEMRTNISNIELDISSKKEKISELQLQIKPVRRVVRKLNPDGIKFESVSPHDRKSIRQEIKLLKNQVILKEDELDKMKTNYAGYNIDITTDMKNTELINKGQSTYWTKRNRWSVEARIVKTLNRLKADDVVTLRKLSRLAKSNADNSKLKFDNELQKVLDEFDPETSILCSYALRSTMYEAIRLTLSEWNSRSTADFTKLIFPEKQ